MRLLKSASVAALIIGLASPVLAQADPHHPDAAGAAPAIEGADTAPTVAGTETAPPVEMPAASVTGPTASGCPDMMSMMKMMMQPGAGDTQPMMMQMMAMMQSMQMMQMQMMQQMQAMQSAMPKQGPDMPGREGSP